MADQIDKGDQGKPSPCKRIKGMFEGDPEDSSNVGLEDAPITGICSRPLLVASSDSFFYSNSLERCWDYAVWPNNPGLFQFWQRSRAVNSLPGGEPDPIDSR